MLRKLITNSLTIAGLLVFLSHQIQSKKNKIIINIQDHYPRKIRIEFLSRFGLIKSERQKKREPRDQRKGKPKNQRREEQETTRKGEKGSGFHPPDPTKTNKHTSLTKKSLLINLCFLKNPCFPGRSHSKIKVS
jgi:hypothetical protein